MSVRVLSKVFRYSKAELADRLTILVLADQSSDDGVTWLDQERVAERTRLSVRSVRRSLRGLEDLGEIETRKAQRGRRRVNVYRVRMPGLPEVDYERLPFALTEPFTTGQIDRSSEIDDRTSTTATTGQPRARGGTKPLEGPVRESANALSLADVPKRWRDEDGRAPDFDALAETCTADPDARGGEIALALYGSQRSPGIRRLIWRDLTPEGREAFRSPEAFAGVVEEEIRRRAALYRERMHDATLTPTALAKWWADLPKLPAGSKMRPSEIAAMFEGQE